MACLPIFLGQIGHPNPNISAVFPGRFFELGRLHHLFCSELGRPDWDFLLDWDNLNLVPIRPKSH